MAEVYRDAGAPVAAVDLVSPDADDALLDTFSIDAVSAAIMR